MSTMFSLAQQVLMVGVGVVAMAISAEAVWRVNHSWEGVVMLPFIVGSVSFSAGIWFPFGQWLSNEMSLSVYSAMYVEWFGAVLISVITLLAAAVYADTRRYSRFDKRGKSQTGQ